MQKHETEETMSYRYRLHPLGKLDYDEAYEWYEDKQKGLGERFLKSPAKKQTEISLKCCFINVIKKLFKR